MSDNLIKSHWNEVWKPIIPPRPTKKCDYFISNYGRVKSFHKDWKREKLVVGYKNSYGARIIKIDTVGDKKFEYVKHKLVAKNFLDYQESTEGRTYIIHLDGNKENNYYKNLKVVDQKEMTQILIEKGVYKSENRNFGATVKMNESKVRLLKERIKKGKTKKKVLAKSFGITYMQLNRIERGENWGHVK